MTREDTSFNWLVNDGAGNIAVAMLCHKISPQKINIMIRSLETKVGGVRGRHLKVEERNDPLHSEPVLGEPKGASETHGKPDITTQRLHFLGRGL